MKSSSDTKAVIYDVLTTIVGALCFLVILVLVGIFVGLFFPNMHVANNDLMAVGQPAGTENYNPSCLFRYYMGFMAVIILVVCYSAGLASSGESIPAYMGAIASCIATILLVVLFFVSYFVYGKRANTNGVTENIADDLRKCCVPLFYNNPLNGCPNSFYTNKTCIAPYDTTTIADLGWNKEYTYLFYSQIPITIFTVFIAIACFMSVHAESVVSQFTKMFISSAVRSVIPKRWHKSLAKMNKVRRNQ